MPVLAALEPLSESLPVAALAYAANAGSVLGISASQFVFLLLFLWYSMDVLMLVLNQVSC